MRPFNRRNEELSVQDGCVLWGSRVIIPKRGQQGVLELLHEGHPGISRMKAIARSIVWWPGLANEIEEMVRNCSHCQQHQKTPRQSPLHPWEWPDQPWLRLHIVPRWAISGEALPNPGGCTLPSRWKWKLYHLRQHHIPSRSYAECYAESLQHMAYQK